MFILAGLLGAQGTRTRFKVDALLSDVDCPEVVRVNGKKDCVDEAGIVVDEKCCGQVQACKADVQSQVPVVQGRLQQYLGACKVKQTDLKPAGDGSFTIKDTSNLCSDTCQGLSELASPLDIGLEDLMNRCGQEESLETLTRMATLVGALDDAWKSCGAVEEETTTTTAPKTPETGGEQEVDLFDPEPDTAAVVYVIDRTWSMEKVACPNAGWHYTRFDFAVIEATKAIARLRETQKFNVIVFDRSPVAMEEAPVPATQANKEKTLAFLSNHGPREGFTAYWHSTGRNIEKAIRVAFSNAGVGSVQLLSDGAATAGKQVATAIIHDEYNHVNPVPMHTLLFMPGVDESDGDKQKAKQLLTDLATETGGSYKEPFPQMPKKCPARVGEKMYVSGAGMPEVNGWWIQEGQTRGRPRYVRDPAHFLDWDGYDYVIEWSAQRSAWRLYRNNLFQYGRDTLYFNREDRHIMPIENWITKSGANPPPTVENYLDYMSAGHHARAS